MKKAKAFLARVLTAAVMITSLLPSGGMTANAADVQISEEGWKVQKESSNWSDDFDDFLNLGGIQTWHIESTLADKNIHNQGLAHADAPAAVYAADIDITAPAETTGTNRIISFDMLPKHKEGTSGSTVDNMRFGVLLKYVDPTNWVYLGCDPTGWFLEWDVQGASSYSAITFDDSATFALEDDKFHHVEIEYLSSSKIKVTLQKMEQNEEGAWVATEADPVTVTLDHFSIQAIKTYATVSAQAPTGGSLPLPIHFGFKAGTYNNTLTDIDIANVQTNANIRNEMESLRYAYCGWTAIKENRNPREILSVSSVGGVNYSSIDASESDTAKTVSYTNNTMKDFNSGNISAVLRPFGEEDSNVTNEFYLNARAATSQSPESPLGVQVGYSGEKWGYKIGETFTEAGTQGAGPKAMHDYRVDISFTKDNKFSASIVEVKHAGDEDEVNGGDEYLKGDFSTVVADSEIEIAKDVTLPDNAPKTGTISITAGAGLNLRLRNVNYAKATYQSATDFLGDAYTTVMNRNNADNTFYTEPWTAFVNARTAANNKLTADGVITEQGATALLQEMTDAWTVLNVDENKTATGKTALEEAKADLEAKGDKDYYSYDEEAYNAAKAAVDAAYNKVSDSQTAVTKAEVTAALDLWENLVFTPVTATEEDKAQIGNAVQEAESKIPAADAAFYDNYEAYESALNALKALQNKENVSKKEIKDAIAELQNAMADCKLTVADQSDKDAAKTSIASIKADVEKNLQPDAAYNAALKKAEDLANSTGEVTKKALADALKALETAKGKLSKKTGTVTPKLSNGQKGTFNNNDYTVVDAQKKTVALTTWNGDKKKLKKVTIPTQVTISGETCTVVSVSANAFKGYKNLQTLTFGATIESVAKGAVSGSKKLKTVTFKNANTKVAKAAFKNVTKKVTVKVPKSVKKNSKAKTKFGKMIKKGGIKKYTIK